MATVKIVKTGFGMLRGPIAGGPFDCSSFQLVRLQLVRLQIVPARSTAARQPRDERNSGFNRVHNYRYGALCGLYVVAVYLKKEMLLPDVHNVEVGPLDSDQRLHEYIVRRRRGHGQHPG